MKKNPTKYLLNMVIPQGPTGPSGVSDTIRIGKTTTVDADQEAQVVDTQEGNNHVLDFVIPKGQKGDPGPLKISSAYLVTYHQIDFPTTGFEVASLGRIPIKREELDIDGLCEVNTDENTIKFNKVGYYAITCTVNKDFWAIWFRLVGTDNVYIGASQFVNNNIANQITAQGIIAVENNNNIYELVNLSPTSIYLNSPQLEKLSTTSYFANSLVTIVIEYLGRP